LKNWHKLCLGTVFDDTQKYSSLSFMQAQNRDFAGRTSSAFATNSPGATSILEAKRKMIRL
jgi:hypothetical protein